jgi:hypothetical protein
MESSCEFTNKAVAESQQGEVLQRGGGARD